MSENVESSSSSFPRQSEKDESTVATVSSHSYFSLLSNTIGKPTTRRFSQFTAIPSSTDNHEVSISTSTTCSQSPFAMPAFDFGDDVDSVMTTTSDSPSLNQCKDEIQDNNKTIENGNKTPFLNSSRGISHYNHDSSLLYTEGTSIDLLFSHSINQSLKQQKLHRPLHPPTNSISPSTTHGKAANVQEKEKVEKVDEGTRSIKLHQMNLLGKKEGFTILQAIYFLIEVDLISSRGEGLNFLHLLEKHHILEPSIFFI